MATSAAALPQRALPIAPQLPSVDRGAFRRAATLVWHSMRTQEGATLMAATAAATMTQRLNFVALPLLAPLAVTPAARIGLVTAALASELVSVPLAQVGQSFAFNRFVTRFMQNDASQLSDRLWGKARLWKDPKVEGGARQRIIKGGNALALSVGGFLADAARVGINLAVGAWGLSAAAGMSWPLIAVSVGCALFPIVLRLVLSGYFTRFEAGMVDSDQKVQTHIQNFWDSTVIGTAFVKNRWLDNYNSALKTARDNSWLNRQLLSACAGLERLPDAIVQRLTTFSFVHERYFNEGAQLMSFATLNVLQGSQAALAGVGNGLSLLTELQRIAVRMTVQSRLQNNIAKAQHLRAFIDPEKISVVTDGKKVDVALLMAHPDRLATPGLTTIKANNGSGKTAFLTLLREHFAGDAIFLPAASRQDFGLPKGSTGEYAMNHFCYIDQLPKLPQIILLDEWRANLDAANILRVLTMIDRWKKSASVVEVVNTH